MLNTLLLIFLTLPIIIGEAELRPGFYSKTCPEAESTVREVTRKAMIREVRSAASVMRLQFHDCFVNSGGPNWEVKLGRLDSLTASQQASDDIMPSPRANASSLINLFAKFNLTVKDLVALSGSHSIGKGRCFSVMHRLYNQTETGQPDSAFTPEYRDKLYKLCPLNVDQNITVNLDATPALFDNQYLKDLVAGRGFLNSDETLYTFNKTRPWVVKFSENQDGFFRAFVDGRIKMGDLQSGRPGEIRRNCRVVNNDEPSELDSMPFRPF